MFFFSDWYNSNMTEITYLCLMSEDSVESDQGLAEKEWKKKDESDKWVCMSTGEPDITF